MALFSWKMGKCCTKNAVKKFLHFSLDLFPIICDCNRMSKKRNEKHNYLDE